MTHTFLQYSNLIIVTLYST